MSCFFVPKSFELIKQLQVFAKLQVLLEGTLILYTEELT